MQSKHSPNDKICVEFGVRGGGVFNMETTRDYANQQLSGLLNFYFANII